MYTKKPAIRNLVLAVVARIAAGWWTAAPAGEHMPTVTVTAPAPKGLRDLSRLGDALHQDAYRAAVYTRVVVTAGLDMRFTQNRQIRLAAASTRRNRG